MSAPRDLAIAYAIRKRSQKGFKPLRPTPEDPAALTDLPEMEDMELGGETGLDSDSLELEADLVTDAAGEKPKSLKLKDQVLTRALEKLRARGQSPLPADES